MSYCETFLRAVIQDIWRITQFEIISGISIWTVLFYCFLATCFYSVFTHR